MKINKLIIKYFVNKFFQKMKINKKKNKKLFLLEILDIKFTNNLKKNVYKKEINHYYNYLNYLKIIENLN